MPVIWRREDQPNLFSVSLIGWTSRQSPWSRQRGIYSYQQNTPFYVFQKNTSIFINSCILLFLLLVREESASAAPPSMSFHFCYFYSKRTAPPDSVRQLDSSFSFFLKISSHLFRLPIPLCANCQHNVVVCLPVSKIVRSTHCVIYRSNFAPSFDDDTFPKFEKNLLIGY